MRLYLMFIACLLYSYTVLSLNNRVVFGICESPSGHIDFMNFGPCLFNGIPDYCQVRRNTTANLSVNFTSHVYTSQVTTVVHGNITETYIPLLMSLVYPDGTQGVRFSNIQEDACLGNNVDHCQLTVREQVHYQNSLFIGPEYPLMAFTLKWEIKDDKGRNMACIGIPLEIVQ